MSGTRKGHPRQKRGDSPAAMGPPEVRYLQPFCGKFRPEANFLHHDELILRMHTNPRDIRENAPYKVSLYDDNGIHAKLKKARTVVLLPPVIDALQRYLAGRSEGWLFPGYSGDHISARQVQKILDRIAERSGLQKVEHQDRVGPGRYRIHPHLLRHSFAMWSLDNGVPIYDLQKQLGHASLAATGVYLEASPNHRREAYLRSGLSDCLAGEKS